MSEDWAEVIRAPDLALPKRSATGRIDGARLLEWAAIPIGLALWELLGQVMDFAFLPPFSSVLRASWELVISGQILGNLAASLASLGVGYGLAVVLGVAVGALMGRYWVVEHLLDIYVNAFLAAPSLIFVPVLFALFGVSRISQAAVIFIYAFFIIVANTRTGIQE